ncbi:MAG: ArnT family glycosyltransferase, partial [Myxococcota bacterium]
VISAIFEILTGYNNNAVIYSNFIYVLLIIFSVFGISKVIHSNLAGFYSVILLLLIPGFIGFTRLYSLDLPLGAIIILTIYMFILFSENFSTARALILGLVISLGVLIRPQYLLYIFIPMIIFSIKIVDNQREGSEFLPFLPITLGMLSLLYWVTEYPNKIDGAFQQLFLHLGKDIFQPDYKFGFDLNYKPFGIDYFSFYIKVYLVNSGIINFVIFTPLIFSSVVIAFKRKMTLSPYIIVMTSFIWIYLLLSIMSSKVPKYFMVEYPLIAIISGCTIASIESRIIRYFIHLFIFFSIIFNILLSHSQTFNFFVSDNTYKIFGPASEMWERPIDGKGYKDIASQIASLLKELSTKKPYPYVCIIPEITNIEKIYFIESQYQNLIYLIRRYFSPWLSIRVENTDASEIEYFRSKAILPMNYSLIFRNNTAGVTCYRESDIIIAIRQIDAKNQIDIKDKTLSGINDYKRIYISNLIKGLREWWTDAIVEVYVRKDMN